MADLKYAEKSLLEKLLGMSSGYVLNFSNRTFAEFFADSVGIDILDDKYAANGDSKARRLRFFWQTEEDHIVGKVLSDLIELVSDDLDDATAKLKAKCSQIAERLVGGMAVEDISALEAPSEERTFQMLASSVKGSISDGEPVAALDRLHTYVMKYMRQVCKSRNIDTSQDKPLHAMTGEYIKLLKADGQIESDLSERILKNSIAIMEAFNIVRNRHSLAHDNDILGNAESLLIVNHIVSTIRFIRTVEARRTGGK